MTHSVVLIVVVVVVVVDRGELCTSIVQKILDNMELYNFSTFSCLRG